MISEIEVNDTEVAVKKNTSFHDWNPTRMHPLLLGAAVPSRAGWGLGSLAGHSCARTGWQTPGSLVLPLRQQGREEHPPADMPA